MDNQGIQYQHVQNSPSWVVGLASLFAIAIFSLLLGDDGVSRPNISGLLLCDPS